MSTVPQLQQDELEILQAETPGTEPPVRVEIARIEVPVRTQGLPRKAGATIQKTVGTTPQRILLSDHRRASASIMSVGQNMLFSYSQAGAQDPSKFMALWPANLPFVMTIDGELWVASATATTVISVVTEFWATGD